MPRQAHSTSITDMTRILRAHQDLCCHVSRISHTTAASDCWRERIPQKQGKLILPFGSERLPQWIATFQNIHVQTFHLLLPAQTWQYKRTTLKFYLVLFRLPWPEQGGNVSNQLSYLQEAPSALQYNSPDLQVAVSHLGAQPWSGGHPEYQDSPRLVPSLLRLLR